MATIQPTDDYKQLLKYVQQKADQTIEDHQKEVEALLEDDWKLIGVTSADSKVVSVLSKIQIKESKPLGFN